MFMDWLARRKEARDKRRKEYLRKQAQKKLIKSTYNQAFHEESLRLAGDKARIKAQEKLERDKVKLLKLRQERKLLEDMNNRKRRRVVLEEDADSDFLGLKNYDPFKKTL